MPPLPADLPEWLRGHPKHAEIASAYAICVRLEERLQEEVFTSRGAARRERNDKLIFCRILGYLIHYPPTSQAIKIIVYEVVSSKDDEALLKVGEMYFNHFIRPFRSNKGRTPTPSAHASRPSFDRLADMKMHMLKEAPQDHQTAKKNALVRDGFRCVVTKLYDYHTAMVNEELKEIVKSAGAPPAVTHCAHIFSESTNANITSGSDKERYAASVWAVLDRFGYRGVFKELNGPKIHRLENVITLEGSLHDAFDRLDVWFTATGEPNKYKLEAADSMLLFTRPEFVTFSSPDPTKLPLPNPAYLHIHATCAKVAHLSGASEYIEQVLRDLEEIRVLAEDGGSSRLLNEAILSSAMRLISV